MLALFRTFLQWFYQNIFWMHYWCVSGNIVSRVFSPIFGHDIRVNIKNLFSQFFATIFIPTFFLLALLVCFWKNCFAGFSTHFRSRYSCDYKKRFFALFSDDFFPKIFRSHYSCVSGKIVSRVFSPMFWLPYSCAY